MQMPVLVELSGFYSLTVFPGCSKSCHSRSQSRPVCFLSSWTSALAADLAYPWTSASCSTEATALDAVLPLPGTCTWQCLRLALATAHIPAATCRQVPLIPL